MFVKNVASHTYELKDRFHSLHCCIQTLTIREVNSIWTSKCMLYYYMVRVMVFNAIFNNISVTSLWSVLLVVKTGEPGENHRPYASHWQTLSHYAVSSTPRHERDSNICLAHFSFRKRSFILFPKVRPLNVHEQKTDSLFKGKRRNFSFRYTDDGISI